MITLLGCFEVKHQVAFERAEVGSEDMHPSRET